MRKWNLTFLLCSTHCTEPTKILTIFGSAYIFLHKIKHTSQFCIKEKGKGHCSYGRPARLWPKPAHALNPPSPLSLQDVDGEAPPVSFVFNAHGDTAAAPTAGSEAFGPRTRAHQLRLELVVPLAPSNRTLPYLYHLGHEKSGRPPWPTVGRPLGPGREQTK